MALLQPNTERRLRRYGGNQCKPPDALILSPVNHAASSEARKTATGATSSGRPKRAPSWPVSTPSRYIRVEWWNRRSDSVSRIIWVRSRAILLSGIVMPAMVLDIFDLQSVRTATECRYAVRRYCRVRGGTFEKSEPSPSAIVG